MSEQVSGYERIRRDRIDPQGAQNLVEGVVKWAVHDWIIAVKAQKKARSGKPSGRRLECERFFCSEYFFDLTGLDGRVVLDKLKKLHNVT